MLEMAALRPGEHVLELACGAGRVGLRAAEQVGEDGRVVCSDFAEPMVDAVRSRVAAAGISNVDARVLDAERFELPPDERFDVVLCRSGYMLMPDPGAALRRSRIALRPRGRLVLAVWGPAERNPWINGVFDVTMAQLGAPPPPPSAPGPFALSDHDRLDGLLLEAGFENRRIVDLASEQRYDSLDDWWRRLTELSGPLATLFAALPQDQADAIKEKAFDAAQPFATGREARFPASVTAAHAENQG